MAGPLTYDPQTWHQRVLTDPLAARTDSIIRKTYAGTQASPDYSRLVPAISQAVSGGTADDQIVSQLQKQIGIGPAVQQQQSAAAVGAIGTPQPGAPAPGQIGQPPQAPAGQPQTVDPGVAARQVLQSAAALPPKYADYAINLKTGQPNTPAQQLADYQSGIANWQFMLQQAVSVVKGVNELQSGVIDVGGGRFITQAQFNDLDPQSQQQVASLYQQQNAKTTQAYNQLMDSIGLQRYQTADAARANDNAALSAEFQNKLAVVNQQVSLGNATVTQAAQDVLRSISGINANTTRATDITDAQMKAAPRAIDPSQIPGLNQQASSILGNIARYAGSPGMPQFSPFGTTTVDPAALMASLDQQRRVGGALPSIPNPFANITAMQASQVPKPQMSATLPAQSNYAPIPQLPIPSSTKPVAVDQFGEPIPAGR